MRLAAPRPAVTVARKPREPAEKNLAAFPPEAR